MNELAELSLVELAEIEQSIGTLLDTPPYTMDPVKRRSTLLALFKQELQYACQRNPQFRNYVQQWPVCLDTADRIADLPYLPVSVFKANPPLALVPPDKITRTLTSSSTSGQLPSRIALDASTSRRMTKGVVAIIRNFIGPARRPYLIIDTEENLGRQAELGARGAAIQALGSFATEIVPCLRVSRQGPVQGLDTQRGDPQRDDAQSGGPRGDPGLDLEKLLAFAEKWKDADVLVYGFTYVIWNQLVQPLQRQDITLRMPNVHLLHSGGWKRLLEQAVTKDVFIRDAAKIFGCSLDRVIDYYGMVENVGVVYPDCEWGYKHVPAFADVIIRDPLTLAPADVGLPGLVQVCSVLPTSFPGFLLLTDDMGEMIGCDRCLCGRRGPYFRFLRRVPRVEVRGCGNLETTRQRLGLEVALHA
jgi:hypothetical protein